MESIKVVMRWVRDSKNAHRYEADPLPSGIIVGPVYLPKILFEDGTPPPTITTMVVIGDQEGPVTAEPVTRMAARQAP